MPRAIDMMKNRQRAMTRALLAVRTLARAALRSGTPPDFAEMKRLVVYLDRYALKAHQGAEERHLFRLIEKRQPAAARAVARGKRDHAACMGHLVRLRTALGYWEKGDAKAGPETALHADDFLDFARLHARVEARDLLSVAREVLSETDWHAVETGYAGTRDPLADAGSRKDCAAAVRALA